MNEFEQQKFTGERAQYFAKDTIYKNCIFEDGESPLKHSKNLKIFNTSFKYKYPLWNTENVYVKDCTFYELSRSGLWYVKDFTMEDSLIIAPKEFRQSSGINLKNVTFKDASETFWNCSKIKLENVKAKGDYFALNSKDFFADKFELEGNYFLDGGKNIEIHNAKLISKDSFWNCENVSIYDSYIVGEYLAWNSKNIKFVNCTIESNQGLCYIDGLKMENCKLINTDLAFEYSKNIDAEIKSSIVSVKNPCGGKIYADEIGTLIMNPARCDVGSTEIICDKIGQKFTEDPNLNEH